MNGLNLEDGSLLTVEEVARLLRVPKSWVYEHIRPERGDPLPSVKLGKYVRFETSALREWLERQRKS